MGWIKKIAVVAALVGVGLGVYSCRISLGLAPISSIDYSKVKTISIAILQKASEKDISSIVVKCTLSILDSTLIGENSNYSTISIVYFRFAIKHTVLLVSLYSIARMWTSNMTNNRFIRGIHRNDRKFKSNRVLPHFGVIVVFINDNFNLAQRVRGNYNRIRRYSFRRKLFHGDTS